MALREVFLLAIMCFQLYHCKSVQKLSCKQIKQFVDGHNSRRLQLSKGQVGGQPAASEMKYMIWDDELAAKATKWAAQNHRYHNPDTSVGSGRFSTGENLYWFSTTDHTFKLNMEDAMAAWWNEHKDYKYGPLKYSDFSNDSPQIGHYTQMAWSNSVYVGCGVLQTIEGDWKKYYVVCNYGPGGNFLGHAPYKSGSPSGKLVCATDNCSRPYGDTC